MPFYSEVKQDRRNYLVVMWKSQGVKTVAFSLMVCTCEIVLWERVAMPVLVPKPSSLLTLYNTSFSPFTVSLLYIIKSTKHSEVVSGKLDIFLIKTI